ncbi:MAG: hypothetical protein Q7U04_04770 [Bacteriovorax sp.]|nr:hypothetical protein [Bacteriovorax sp.]
MNNKDLGKEERQKLLLASFSEKTPKQMRTIRNNLNNRITSFEQEMKLGKSLPALQASNVLFDFDLKDCRILLAAAKKVIKTH